MVALYARPTCEVTHAYADAHIYTRRHTHTRARVREDSRTKIIRSTTLSRPRATADDPCVPVLLLMCVTNPHIRVRHHYRCAAAAVAVAAAAVDDDDAVHRCASIKRTESDFGIGSVCCRRSDVKQATRLLRLRYV